MNISFDLGLLAGIVTVLLVILAVVYRRKRMLNEFHFRIHGPSVPEKVLDAVRKAEGRFYVDLPFWRKRIEDLQDMSGFLWPALVYRFDFSVGAYRIKARTIERIIQYALDQNYLTIYPAPNASYRFLLAYFSLQPILSEWQASLLLQSLKDQHPALREMAWSDIAEQPLLIAKLYSGYMGAGGDWELWRSGLTPGPIACHRMNLYPATP